MTDFPLIQVFFWCSQIVLALYLGAKTRRIDIMSLAGGTLILVSLPLWLGGYMGVSGMPRYRIPPEVYFSLGLMAILLLAATVVVDSRKPRPRTGSQRISRSMFRLVGVVLLTACAGSFLVMVQRMGIVLLFASSKRDLMDNAAFALSFFAACCELLSCWLFYYGKRIAKGGAVAVLLFTVFLGFRTPIVIVGLTLVLLYCRDMKPISVLKRRPVLVPTLIVVSIAFIGLAKPLYGTWKYGGMSAVTQRIEEDGIGDLMQRGFEFMNTEYSFVAIVDRGFSTDGGTILRGPLSFFPVPRSYYTTPSNEFNHLYQPALFPGHVSGMAANPFAEFYAGAGLPGVIVFELLFVGALLGFAQLIRKPRKWEVIWALMGVLVAFYIHRNAMGTIFGFLRNVFWPFALCMWASLLLVRLSRKPSSRYRTRSFQVERSLSGDI